MSTLASTNPLGHPWPATRTPWPTRSAPLYGPDFARDPFSYYDSLRRTFGPVAPVTLEETGAFRGYLVLDHGHQLDVLQNRRQVWTRDSRWYRDLAEGALPPDHPIIPQFAYRRSRLYAEGTEHERLSTPGIRALAELDLLRTRDLIEDLAEQLISALFTDEEPGEVNEADILHQYALQLPLLVLMRLMGMDESSALATGNAIHEMLSGGPGAAQAAADLDATMRALVTERQTNPGPDLVSWMHHHNQESGLDLAELSEDVWLQIVAGRGASTTWICNTVLELLTNPDLNADVVAARCSMSEAMNHVMWINAPIQNLIGRWATQPTTLGGYDVNVGDLAILSLGAISADPAMRGVDQYISRTNKAHLAWGAGTHGCPARDLGGLIVRTGLEVLWERLPGMRLAVPKEALTWDLPYVARSPSSLPVIFPRPPAAPKDGQPWTTQPKFISSPPRPISTEPKERPSERQGRLPRWRSLVAWWPRR
ncbi:cytochrome P450 family protein [Streptomyces litchfieldiae]|uniref:Cytochrome P450 n=1 Tax=Streptomyces litchfieldiae TaxID=3075543 RepID=A0ABU2MTY8_9ACTN|nr:cytochrome P450 [Streptomyces sp. DSM 44938]MDT0345101.1 cytochrome P450 [Streptomyces sp. DSM 44938]